MKNDKIEPGKLFLKLEKSFGKYYYSEYRSNAYSEFHVVTKDWNCDGKVYPLNVAYFYNDDDINCAVTKDVFESEFFEVDNDSCDDRMFMNTSGIVYNIMQQFVYDNEKLVFIKRLDGVCNSLKTLKEFNEEFKEVVFK